MSRRDFDEGISYLKENFESSWGLLIESACKENLCQFQPKRSKFKAYAKPHIYGPCEILICEGNFR